MMVMVMVSGRTSTWVRGSGRVRESERMKVRRRVGG